MTEVGFCFGTFDPNPALTHKITGLLLLMIAQGVSARNFMFFLLCLEHLLITTKTVRLAGKSQLTRVVYRDGEFLSYQCHAIPLMVHLPLGILYYVYIFGAYFWRNKPRSQK